MEILKLSWNVTIMLKSFHFTFEGSNCGLSSSYVHMELGLYFPDGMWEPERI
jgi:hypothetical protein